MTGRDDLAAFSEPAAAHAHERRRVVGALVRGIDGVDDVSGCDCVRTVRATTFGVVLALVMLAGVAGYDRWQADVDPPQVSSPAAR
jgi:hypothetical protein